MCHGSVGFRVRAVSAPGGVCDVGLWRTVSAAVKQNTLIFGPDSHRRWGTCVRSEIWEKGARMNVGQHAVEGGQAGLGGGDADVAAAEVSAARCRALRDRGQGRYA